ncbi:CBS domain-containing protein [Bacillus massilinigeriensis]|uniref:CBS domain-containing protein n=1 Tax=Bacillus mediterraneensis TaxID=1805474 RepID=UPI0008F8BCEC|nr:CBS domain-containing protein [Bacillus mediterraneensis]
MEKVSDLMTASVETCSLLDNVFEVAVKMREHNVGCIPIVDGENLVGLMTDRDIVIRGVAEKRPPSSKVEELMTGAIISISPDASTEEAAKMMAKHQIRRLPVVDNGKLIGIVALGDLAIDQKTDNQAKQALTNISEQSHPLQ